MKTPKRMPADLTFWVDMEKKLFDMELVSCRLEPVNGHRLLFWHTVTMNADGEGYIGVFQECWSKKKREIKSRQSRVRFNLQELQGLFERNFK